MRHRSTGAAVAALIAAAAVGYGAGAEAQEYDRLVVFGDSLSDNGNLFALSGGTQPPSPPYWNGRFSDGQVFAERLGFSLTGYGTTAGSVNYAFGGARTDGLVAFPFGIGQQLTDYMAFGGTFGANDLVSVWGGANNIFQGVLPAAGSPNPAAAMNTIALGAATDLTTTVGTIAGAGAGTVLVMNLPRLSATPAFLGGPAAPLVDLGAGTFNRALLQGMQAVAAGAPNTNIIYMDVFKATDAFAAAPSRFGVTNATQPCFDGVTVCANPEDFFYYDSVHPTSTGHALLADLAEDYLYYGDLGAPTGVQGEVALRHRQDALEMATGHLGARGGWASGTNISVAAYGEAATSDARGAVAEAESEGYGLRMALETGPSENLRLGFGAGSTVSEVDVGALSFEAESFGVDAWAGWRSGSVFVVASGGWSRDNFDGIERITSIAPIVHTANTQGDSLGARLQAGMWFDMGGIALSPRAAVTWTSSEVDGYVERGAAATQRVGARSIDATSGEIALRAEMGMGERSSLYLEGGFRDQFSYDADAVAIGLTDNSAQTLFTDLNDPFGSGALVNAGVQMQMTDQLSLSAGYRGRFGDTESHQGGIVLRLGF